MRLSSRKALAADLVRALSPPPRTLSTLADVVLWAARGRPGERVRLSPELEPLIAFAGDAEKSDETPRTQRSYVTRPQKRSGPVT
jgi:hypothetical protein